MSRQSGNKIRSKGTEKSSREAAAAKRNRGLSRLQKKDFIFLGILALVAIAFLLWFLLGYRKSGNRVEITVDDEFYGTYDLNEEQEIPIEIGGTVTNILLIRDGEADMTEADCPDQICVRHVSISHVGENIVCLPNRVVVSVTGEEEPQLDSVAQ